MGREGRIKGEKERERERGRSINPGRVITGWWGSAQSISQEIRREDRGKKGLGSASVISGSRRERTAFQMTGKLFSARAPQNCRAGSRLFKSEPSGGQ